MSWIKNILKRIGHNQAAHVANPTATASRPINTYHGELSEDAIKQGLHRAWVGGMWDEIGKLQLDFLIEHGLQPENRLLDVGCGCLRGGRYFIRYLNDGHYFGLDINPSLISAGYAHELSPKERNRLPRPNLLVDSFFRASRLNGPFDLALAVSVFTHVPLPYLRLCLTELVAVMPEGTGFYASFFLCPHEESARCSIRHEPGGIVTHPHQDPYHFTLEEIQDAADDLPWSVELLGPWKHPRNQQMILFTRQPAIPSSHPGS